MTKWDKVIGLLLVLAGAWVVGYKSAPDRLACPSRWRPVVSAIGTVMGVTCYDKPVRTIWLH